MKRSRGAMSLVYDDANKKEQLYYFTRHKLLNKIEALKVPQNKRYSRGTRERDIASLRNFNS